MRSRTFSDRPAAFMRFSPLRAMSASVGGSVAATSQPPPPDVGSNTSVFVKALLRKYPRLALEPFQQISRTWQSVGAEVQAHVGLQEQQALNLANSAEQSADFLPSHWAAWRGFCDVLEVVQQTHAPLLIAPDAQGLRPLHWAAKGGQVGALKLLTKVESLVPHLPDTTVSGSTIGTLAAFHDHVAVLAWLHGEGGRLRSLLTKPETSRMQLKSPLHVAAQSGAVNAVQFFLDLPPLAAGPIVQVRDRHGRTAAHYAAESGRCEVLELLHSSRAGGGDEASGATMLSIVDHHGATPLHYAARNPRNDVVMHLHEKVGLSLWELDTAGQSPAVWAVLGGKSQRHTACLEYMLQRDRERMLSSVCAGGRPLLDLVREVHGTECLMYSRLRGLGFPLSP